MIKKKAISFLGHALSWFKFEYGHMYEYFHTSWTDTNKDSG